MGKLLTLTWLFQTLYAIGKLAVDADAAKAIINLKPIPRMVNLLSSDDTEVQANVSVILILRTYFNLQEVQFKTKSFEQWSESVVHEEQYSQLIYSNDTIIVKLRLFVLSRSNFQPYLPVSTYLCGA